MLPIEGTWTVYKLINFKGFEIENIVCSASWEQKTNPINFESTLAQPMGTLVKMQIWWKETIIFFLLWAQYRCIISLWAMLRTCKCPLLNGFIFTLLPPWLYSFIHLSMIVKTRNIVTFKEMCLRFLQFGNYCSISLILPFHIRRIIATEVESIQKHEIGLFCLFISGS